MLWPPIHCSGLEAPCHDHLALYKYDSLKLLEIHPRSFNQPHKLAIAMYARFFHNIEDDKDSLDGGVSINIVLAMENINGLSEMAVSVMDPSNKTCSPTTIVGLPEVRQYEASMHKVVQLFLHSVDFDIPLFPYTKESCFQLLSPQPVAPNYWVARYWRVLRELATMTLTMRYFLAHGVVRTWEGFK